MARSRLDGNPNVHNMFLSVGSQDPNRCALRSPYRAPDDPRPRACRMSRQDAGRLVVQSRRSNRRARASQAGAGCRSPTSNAI